MKLKLNIIFVFILVINIFNCADASDLRVKVFLEGPYQAGEMLEGLVAQGILPNTQPYNVSPWNYNGPESYAMLPSAEIIDWLLIDLLLPSPGVNPVTYDVIEQMAVLLQSDGQLIEVNGSDLLSFQTSITADYYVQVHHRNHLVVTSVNPVYETQPGIFEYDFTTGPNQNADGLHTQKQLTYGVWGAMSGDGDADNHIDNNDKNEIWVSENGLAGYLQADYNLDGLVNSLDLAGKWSTNAGFGLNKRISVLEVCNQNSRYFCKNGQPVFLTGSHIWDNLQDIGDVAFDYEGYLNWVESLGHNFIRLWAWETPFGTDWAKDPNQAISPVPYKLVGNQFDVTQLNPVYFDRLLQRLQAADERGLYVSIMFFQGFSAEHDPAAWQHHPFKAGNNINGIATDQFSVHTNFYPQIVEAQHLYVKQVIDLVNEHEFTNVLYEIGNEIPHSELSDVWHYDMIDFIHHYEYNTYGINRPVGMVFQYSNGTNQALFDSPADWISPGPDNGFNCQDPEDAPISTGEKVIISDTDHFYYLNYHNLGDPQDMVWRSFTGGIQVIHMDNWGGGNNQPGRLHGVASQNTYQVIRNNMGYARQLADDLDLLKMVPQPQLSSTGFCLASDHELVAYLPQNTSFVSVDMTGFQGVYSIQWLNTTTGEWHTGTNISGGVTLNLNSPFSEYSVLVITKLY